MKPPKSIADSMIEDAEVETLQDVMLYELLEEIEMISDPGIKAFIRAILLRADPFWEASAVQNDFSHPPDERIEGGMVLHTKRVCRTVYLLSNTFDCSLQDLDIMIAAALLHDITKANWRDESRREMVYDVMHAYSVDAFIAWCTTEDISTVEGTANTVQVAPEVLAKILRLIRCSHGAWSAIPETMPVTVAEKILHIADLVASNLHIILDGPDIIEERWTV